MDEHKKRQQQYLFTRELSKYGFEIRSIGQAINGHLHSSYVKEQGCSELRIIVYKHKVAKIIVDNHDGKPHTKYYGLMPATKKDLQVLFKLLYIKKWN
jgi:hypothetical protein